jgi:hypothetical protein
MLHQMHRCGVFRIVEWMQLRFSLQRRAQVGGKGRPRQTLGLAEGGHFMEVRGNGAGGGNALFVEEKSGEVAQEGVANGRACLAGSHVKQVGAVDAETGGRGCYRRYAPSCPRKLGAQAGCVAMKGIRGSPSLPPDAASAATVASPAEVGKVGGLAARSSAIKVLAQVTDCRGG